MSTLSPMATADAAPSSAAGSASVRAHWPEYLMEAAELGLFMLSATAVTALLEHPGSPLRQALPDAFVRRALIGLGMAATAITITYSPLGQQSGAHFNPAVTLTFFRLGKIKASDAVFYVLAQFVGGIAGVLVSAVLLGMAIAHPSVRFATTRPGAYGTGIAFAAELTISFFLMLTVLSVSNSKRFARLTPLCAGALVATYITFEAPISGMSMNPARTFGSALPAGIFTALWIYFTAPVFGMLLAAETYTRIGRCRPVYCAKINHHTHRRCIFRCGYRAE
ncbi:MAG TPA: aquaporin [Myxococcota bacterium]|nr:aquaporin [Myxococcota bacterium]